MQILNICTSYILFYNHKPCLLWGAAIAMQGATDQMCQNMKSNHNFPEWKLSNIIATITDAANSEHLYGPYHVL